MGLSIQTMPKPPPVEREFITTQLKHILLKIANSLVCDTSKLIECSFSSDDRNFLLILWKIRAKLVLLESQVRHKKCFDSKGRVLKLIKYIKCVASKMMVTSPDDMPKMKRMAKAIGNGAHSLKEEIEMVPDRPVRTQPTIQKPFWLLIKKQNLCGYIKSRKGTSSPKLGDPRLPPGTPTQTVSKKNKGVLKREERRKNVCFYDQIESSSCRSEASLDAYSNDSPPSILRNPSPDQYVKRKVDKSNQMEYKVVFVHEINGGGFSLTRGPDRSSIWKNHVSELDTQQIEDASKDLSESKTSYYSSVGFPKEQKVPDNQSLWFESVQALVNEYKQMSDPPQCL